MDTQGFSHTIPATHDSGPMPWAQGLTDIERAERARVRRMRFGIEPGSVFDSDRADEILAAHAEGARMAPAGIQEPSAPVPLTPLERMHRRFEPWARILAGLFAIAALLLAAHLVARLV